MNSEAAGLVGAELALAGVPAEQEQLLRQLESRRIGPQTPLPQMDFLFRLFGRPCFPRGELVALSGKAKSGKTFVSSLLMALAIRSPLLSLERTGQERLHVMWYDTEQSQESTQDILRHRVIPLTAIEETAYPMDLLDVFNVRCEPYERRMPLLEAAIRHYRPDLVVVDGIRDLVADINDGVVAQDTVERLMRLAAEGHCCIVCVLHQNKALEDRNLRGWIGTELKNKAFEVYECTKSSERIFSLQQTDTRKYDIPGRLQFAVGDDGLPYLCTPAQLLDAQFRAQRKAADRQDMEHGMHRLPDFNPRYVLRKEGRRHIFNVRLLFTDMMEAGREYDEDELQKWAYAKANIIKEHIFHEVLRQALNERIVLGVCDPFGHKHYMRPPETDAGARGVQTELTFLPP